MCAKEPTELPLAVRHGCMATSSQGWRIRETPTGNRSRLIEILSVFAVCIQSKKDRTEVTAFLGEGIFTMGCSKNHIMYWGVFTLIIIAWSADEVCTKFTKITTYFCALLQHPPVCYDKIPLQVAQHMPKTGTCVVWQPIGAMTGTALQIRLL